MIYIAPPFGTYFRPRDALPVLGSYTLLPRPGRTGQVLRTLRPVRGGWVNAIGLRNPGVASLGYEPGVVYSVAGIEDDDWGKLLGHLHSFDWPAYRIELNLSCPNVSECGLPPRGVLEGFVRLPNAMIIAKLPPTMLASLFIVRCLEAGIKLIHLSNTFPIARGGISGAPLRAINLPLVEFVAKGWPRAEIIAGGGIYAAEHARQYRDAGARHLSLGTVWMNPLRGWLLYRRLRREWA